MHNRGLISVAPSSITPLSLSSSSMTPGSSSGILFFFNGHDFFHAALMASTGKLRGKPLIHDGEGLGRIEDASAQRQHVGIVMLAAHLRFIFCAYVCGPDAIDFVGGNRHANAAAADQNAKIGALLAHVVRHGSGIVRIVN